MTPPVGIIEPVAFAAQGGDVALVKHSVSRRAVFTGILSGARGVTPSDLCVNGRPVRFVFLKLCDGSWLLQCVARELIPSDEVSVRLHASRTVKAELELLACCAEGAGAWLGLATA